MKMSFFGSSRGCSCFQFARTMRTSARSCSAACRLFFEREVLALAEPPHRTGGDDHPPCPQPAADLLQGQVRFGGNQRQQPVLIGIQRRALAAHRLGRHTPVCRQRATQRIAELTPTSKRRRRFMARGARLDRTHHPFTQIPRIGLRHRHLPESPPRDSPIPPTLRIPTQPSDSIRSGYALILAPFQFGLGTGRGRAALRASSVGSLVLGPARCPLR